MATRTEMEQLIKDNLPMIRKSANKYGNRAYVGDLVNDSVISMIRFHDKFAMGTNFSSWVSTVLRNRHCSNNRSKSIKNEIPTDIDALYARNSAKVEFDDSFELGDEMDTYLNCLNETDVMLIRMQADGYSLEEMLPLLDLNMAGLKSKMHRIRKKMRKYRDSGVFDV
jgi:RNA polymerase sigma-70 factor (ECF subfamily)